MAPFSGSGANVITMILSRDSFQRQQSVNRICPHKKGNGNLVVTIGAPDVVGQTPACMGPSPVFATERSFWGVCRSFSNRDRFPSASKPILSSNESHLSNRIFRSVFQLLGPLEDAYFYVAGEGMGVPSSWTYYRVPYGNRQS